MLVNLFACKKEHISAGSQYQYSFKLELLEKAAIESGCTLAYLCEGREMDR